jgi:hypothetical protein
VTLPERLLRIKVIEGIGNELSSQQFKSSFLRGMQLLPLGNRAEVLLLMTKQRLLTSELSGVESKLIL